MFALRRLVGCLRFAVRVLPRRVRSGRKGDAAVVHVWSVHRARPLPTWERELSQPFSQSFTRSACAVGGTRRRGGSAWCTDATPLLTPWSSAELTGWRGVQCCPARGHVHNLSCPETFLMRPCVQVDILVCWSFCALLFFASLLLFFPVRKLLSSSSGHAQARLRSLFAHQLSPAGVSVKGLVYDGLPGTQPLEVQSGAGVCLQPMHRMSTRRRWRTPESKVVCADPRPVRRAPTDRRLAGPSHSLVGLHR